MSFSERYELGIPLGRNPAGIVYAATRTADGQTLAIAIADGQGLTDEAVFEKVRARFRKDFGALKRAKGDQLPTIHEVDEDDTGNPYAAIELIDGESLADKLEDDLELKELGALVDGILRGLEQAHRVRVVHGDLEPGNVLIRENGTPVIVGFAINRVVASAEGASGESAITRSIGYRAPEVEGLPTDARADLYAVGALLHRALTGQMPQAGRSVAEVEPTLGASLAKVIDRALDPQPQGRYASA